MAGNQESSQLFDIADEVRDCIFLKKLHLTAIIGNDAWGRCHKTQPVVLSIRLQHLLSAAGKSDDIDDTVSYGKISKDILEYVGENHAKDFSNAANFTSEIMILATTMKWGGDRLEIMTALPKGSLQAQCGIGYSAVYDWPTTAIPQSSDGLLLRILKKNRYFIRDLRIMSFIGVNEHEKEVQQAVVLNISIAETRDVVEVVEKTCDVPTVSLIQWISLLVEGSRFGTVEALATAIIEGSLDKFRIPSMTVSVEKPSALAFCDGAGVEITRSNPRLH